MEPLLEEMNYAEAIHEAADYLLSEHQDLFFIGQGLWSPWYVGDTMKDLEKKHGKHRVVDTPVSESAVTGLAFGASIAGKKSVVVHPRMDFMLYAADTIINQAAKWHYMFGSKVPLNFTVRCIINRGGAQGAQHSQALHSFFCHIPGLRVVMPYSVGDARDLLIASALSPDPVIFIEDRWLYSERANLSKISVPWNLSEQKPRVVREGNAITVVASGYMVKLALDAAESLALCNIYPEVIDLRVLSPMDLSSVFASISKTGRLLVVDGGWESCGLGAEVITRVVENPSFIKKSVHVSRLSLPCHPAPNNLELEDHYYTSPKQLASRILSMCERVL